MNPHVRKVGSIADYDPMTENYGSLASGYTAYGQPLCYPRKFIRTQ